MTTVVNRRRNDDLGSIICDNDLTRIRVTKTATSLALALDARRSDGAWESLVHTPMDVDALCADQHGSEPVCLYYFFDPIQQHGRTYGVRLHGRLGPGEMVLTAMLDEKGSWCHLTFEFKSANPVPLGRITNTWRMPAGLSTPDVCWPAHPITPSDSLVHPAAFYQSGPLFAALLPDFDEGDREHVALQLRAQDPAEFEFGVMSTHEMPCALRLAYHICLDACAVPTYGYQQVMRMLGNHESLQLINQEASPRHAGALPSLPPVPDAWGWVPFVREGAPTEIAALAYDYLTQAQQADWTTLEQGLCWLDRLCYHQRLFEAPGTPTFGSIGHGEAWMPVTYWMPELLLMAFRLTGLREYAHRAMAAISALPPAHRAVVLAHLHPHFGDIHMNADTGEAVLLTPMETFQPTITPDGIDLQISCPTTATPLHCTMEGALDSYSLIVNGDSLGQIPTEILRTGITLSLPSLTELARGTSQPAHLC